MQATVRKPPVPTDSAGNTVAATALPEIKLQGAKEVSAVTKKQHTAEQVRDPSPYVGTAAQGTDDHLQSNVKQPKAQTEQKTAQTTSQRSQSVMGGRYKCATGTPTNAAERAVAQTGSSKEASRSAVDKPTAQGEQKAAGTTGQRWQSVMGGRSKSAPDPPTNAAELAAIQKDAFTKANSWPVGKWHAAHQRGTLGWRELVQVLYQPKLMLISMYLPRYL